MIVWPLEKFLCSSPEWPQGRVAFTLPFSPADCEANYLLCSKTWLDPSSGSRIDPPPPLSLSLQKISQRGTATIDTGRSNKAGRLRGHHGVAHTLLHWQLPPPAQSHTHPRNLSARASRLAWFTYNNNNKSANEQKLHHNRSTLRKTKGRCLKWNLLSSNHIHCSGAFHVIKARLTV